MLLLFFLACFSTSSNPDICHFLPVNSSKDCTVSFILDSILDKGYSLAIAIDASSNQFEEHKILVENGIDVLVLDHHETTHYSEYATVINNQLSEQYSNKALCGVGVAYKFCKFVLPIINFFF